LDRFLIEESLAEQVYRVKLEAQIAVELHLERSGGGLNTAAPVLDQIASETTLTVRS
jgi:hypothetical protein